MQIINHTLLTETPGTQRQFCSWHFGTPPATSEQKKVYIQAGLHADEIPGMLVVWHLKQFLTQNESLLRGEVVVVPMANPIGSSQMQMYSKQGRFELARGENFNRHFPNAFDALHSTLLPLLADDPAHNRALIRSKVGNWLQSLPVETELQSQRLTLMRLAHDADIVLDLHCDFEAELHLYCEPSCQDSILQLANYLQAPLVLVAQGSGGFCFDEMLSDIWWRLDALAQNESKSIRIPQGCISTTVELRGESDVSHPFAQQDCAAILEFLRAQGVLLDQQPIAAPNNSQVVPLQGSETLYAPHGGIIVHHVPVGALVTSGQVVAEIIEPQSSVSSLLHATIDGRVYARQNDRWARAHMEIVKIAGKNPIRSGYLLSA